MNANAMAKRQFRQIARVSGLIQSGPPGQRKSTSYVQASSNLFFDLFCEYDPTNLLLEQCRREVLEQQFEWTRLDRVLKRLQQAVIENHNVFDVLMDAVRVCSLGQITNALFEVGGQYRRNM